jgi:hypothetical protein
LNNSQLRVESGSRFFDGVAGAVWVLFFGAVVGNTANDFFGVVAAGESALGNSPVAFRLSHFAIGKKSLRAP